MFSKISNFILFLFVMCYKLSALSKLFQLIQPNKILYKREIVVKTKIIYDPIRIISFYFVVSSHCMAQEMGFIIGYMGV